MSSSSSCHFCALPNPAGSKFCNHCGEPLDLKPCKQCDAFNHVAVDRCYQCGTPFAPKEEALAVAETGVAAAVASPAAPLQRAPSKPVRVEPALGPLEHTPVALSDRMEAYTERVAEHVSDAAPLMPLAGAAPEREADDDADWVDPRRQWEARLESRARRRTRAVMAAVAAVVLCAITAGGYVAYDSGWLIRAGAWARTAERSVVASSSAIVDKLSADIGRERETAPAASPGKPPATDSAASPAATAGFATRSVPGDAAAAPASSPAVAQPATEAPAPLATKTLEDSTPSSGSAASSSSPARDTTSPHTAQTTARPAPTSAGKAPHAARSDAPARRTTREAAKAAHPAPAPPRPAVDRDALATQRLIQRDLAGFLPPESPPPR